MAIKWNGEREGRRGEKRNKLTAADVIEIRRLAAEGRRTAELSAMFLVGETQIRNIKRGDQWKTSPQIFE